MANTNKSRLLEIVKQASKANKDLLPIEIDDSDDYQVLAAVLKWRAQCYESFYEDLQEQHDQLKSTVHESHDRACDQPKHGTDFVPAATREKGVVIQIGGVPEAAPWASFLGPTLQSEGHRKPHAWLPSSHTRANPDHRISPTRANSGTLPRQPRCVEEFEEIAPSRARSPPHCLVPSQYHPAVSRKCRSSTLRQPVNGNCDQAPLLHNQCRTGLPVESRSKSFSPLGKLRTSSGGIGLRSPIQSISVAIPEQISKAELLTRQQTRKPRQFGPEERVTTRLRTFPLTPASLNDTCRFTSCAITALNLLYLGPSSSRPLYATGSTACAPIESLAKRIDVLRQTTPAAVFQSLQDLKPPSTRDIEELQDWEACELVNHITADIDTGSPPRGEFRIIDANRIDVPSPTGILEPSWIQYMPPDLAEAFSDPNLRFFKSPLLENLSNTRSLPKPRVHARNGHYAPLLGKLQKAGMLHWSKTSNEHASYSKLANKLTMSLFAVVKDANNDRLIGWPRVQNAFMPRPPITDLPIPDLFANIKLKSHIESFGIFFDKSNMFHCIRLPRHFAMLFPMKTIQFLQLDHETQLAVMQDTGRIFLPTDFVRPLQATMPMGFTWSVAIAHRLANACLRIAYSCARMKIPEHRRPPQQFKCLSQTAGTVHILEGDLLILHIIDDINAIAAGWRSSHLILFYRECDRTFAQHGLRRKPSKPSPLDAVVTDCLPFIGWQWHLHENIIRPDPTKLLNYLSQAMFPSIYSQKTPVRLRSLVGRLIWIALAIRPALSFLKTTFLVTHHTRTSTSALRLAARREVSALSAVLPLAHINPDRKLWTTLVAFDASQAAAGVSFDLITLNAAKFMYDLAAKGHAISPLEMHKYHTIVK
ncbi:hypothetical protein FGB62_38g110 [Gracilaria domingensis]|nr:hypothetical protein FGB62_38g110 [Gracilaria domingensis]